MARLMLAGVQNDRERASRPPEPAPAPTPRVASLTPPVGPPPQAPGRRPDRLRPDEAYPLSEAMALARALADAPDRAAAAEGWARFVAARHREPDNEVTIRHLTRGGIELGPEMLAGWLHEIHRDRCPRPDRVLSKRIRKALPMDRGGGPAGKGNRPSGAPGKNPRGPVAGVSA